MIVTILETGDNSDRAIAAFGLGLLGRSEALPTLVTKVNGKGDWAAMAAVAALSQLGTPEALEALRSAVTQAPLSGIRRMAARALETSTTQVLAEEVLKPSSDYDYYAARALFYVNDPAALPALDKAAKIKGSNNRGAARDSARRIRRLARKKADLPPQRPPTSQPAASSPLPDRPRFH